MSSLAVRHWFAKHCLNITPQEATYNRHFGMLDARPGNHVYTLAFSTQISKSENLLLLIQPHNKTIAFQTCPKWTLKAAVLSAVIDQQKALTVSRPKPAFN